MLGAMSQSAPAVPVGTADLRVRYPELDSLRGIAALAVTVHHFLKVREPSAWGGWYAWFDASPLRVLAGGHEAVQLFFLISGFVLSLSLANGSQTYPSYLTRRIFRLYPPYVVALLVAMAAATQWHGAVAGYSPWFNATWRQPPDLPTVANHLAFVGQYQNYVFNTAFWSLVYEMRISLIFPLILLVAWRYSAWAIVPLVVALSVCAIQTGSKPFYGDWLITVHYAAMFVIGALLARNIEALKRRCRDLDWRWTGLACLIALLLVSYAGLLPHERIGEVTDWLIVPGLCWLLVASLTYDAPRRFLLSAVPVFLGRVSYSLYLLHATVLFGLIHAGEGRIALWQVFVLYMAITLLAAGAMHRLVEEPSIALGRALSHRWRRPERLRRGLAT